MIILDVEGIEGSSGGCVLNEHNEVVGLVTGRIGTDNADAVTVVDAVWGEWIDKLLARREEVLATEKALREAIQPETK